MFIAGTLLTKNETSISANELKHLSNDCAILFFCSAMMAEITIEAFISKAKFNKYSYLGFCCSSFMVVGMVGTIYAVLVFGKYDLTVFNQMNNMSAFQTMIIIFSVAHAIYIKSKLLYEEDKNYQLLSITLKYPSDNDECGNWQSFSYYHDIFTGNRLPEKRAGGNGGGVKNH